MPRTARHRGAQRWTVSSTRRAPVRSSSSRRALAPAVARATRFVSPHPYRTNSASSAGSSTRSVNPPRCNAFQNRLPGRAKWWPTAPEYEPGLMPQKSTSRPGASTSGIVVPTAAATCSGVGRCGIDAQLRRPEWRSRPVSRILCAGLAPPATISLDDTSVVVGPFSGPMRPTRQLGRAVLDRCLLDLAPGGGCQPRRSPAALVRSYRTVSPLPEATMPQAVCSLLPCPRGCPRLALASTLPFGVRTFLERSRPPAAARPAPPHPRIPGP